MLKAYLEPLYRDRGAWFSGDLEKLDFPEHGFPELIGRLMIYSACLVQWVNHHNYTHLLAKL